MDWTTLYLSCLRFLVIIREQYEEWILIEARVEVVCDLSWTSFVFETTMEEARVEARESRLACSYDPAIPLPNAKDDDEGGIDQLEDSAWCDSAYNWDRDGEDYGDQGGDGH